MKNMFSLSLIMLVHPDEVQLKWALTLNAVHCPKSWVCEQEVLSHGNQPGPALVSLVMIGVRMWGWFVLGKEGVLSSIFLILSCFPFLPQRKFWNVSPLTTSFPHHHPFLVSGVPNQTQQPLLWASHHTVYLSPRFSSREMYVEMIQWSANFSF